MMHRVTKQAYMEMAKRLTSTAARFVPARLRETGIAVASERLSRDLGVADKHSEYMVHQVLRETAAELRKLPRTGDVYPGRVIDRAVAQLQELNYQPNDEEIVDRCLDELPAGAYAALRLLKAGKSHQEIADELNTDVETIRRSLTSTYAYIRIQVIAGNEPDRESAVS